MKATVTIHCEHPGGCPNTVTAAWDPSEWWCVLEDEVVLDGHVPLQAEGWDMPGPTYFGDRGPQPTLCPQHAMTVTDAPGSRRASEGSAGS